MAGFGKQLEKKIKGKIIGIKNGTIEVKGAGVNDLLTKLKNIDEASAETLKDEYIEAVKKANADKKK